MTKAPRKAMMTRSRLKNVFLKNQNTTSWNYCKYQRNFCTNLLLKTKSDYFRNLNVKDLNNNKKFWEKIKPFFSDKSLTISNIVLKEKGNLILYCIMLKNGQTYFKNLAVFTPQDF